MSKWKIYEKKIYNILKVKGQSCIFKTNDRIDGHFSGVKRQVDISMRGEMVGHEILGVVECKCFNKKIDVKIVDSFIGFLEDVGANLGIIVTNKGYSKAAKNRAKIKGIRLDIVEFDTIEEYEFDWDICQLCDPGDEKPPAIIYWSNPHGIDNEEISKIVQFGRCDWCNSISIKCQSCGAITPVYEGDYNKVIECEGGCGLEFKVISQYAGDGLMEENIEIVTKPK